MDAVAIEDVYKHMAIKAVAEIAVSSESKQPDDNAIILHHAFDCFDMHGHPWR